MEGNTMRAKFYKALTKVCSLFGSIGSKIQSWAEIKEWEYWNDKQCKILDIPNDVKVFLWYNRKGDFLDVSVNYWPLVDGKYDWNNRPDVMRAKFTREEIHLLATSEDDPQ